MQFKTITLLNSITVDAAADIETAYTLLDGEAFWLAQALARGAATMRSYCGAAKTGSPSASLASMSWSIDGTNFTNFWNFTDVDITTTGEHVLGQITTLNFPYTATKLKLNLLAGYSLDADNKLNQYTASIACAF